MMRIVHISTYDKKGGASIACYRLHEALIDKGIESDMLVMEMSSVYGKRVFATTRKWFKKKINLFRLLIEKLVFLFHEKNPAVRFQFSLANAGEDISAHPLVENASVIHLHWLNHSFISINGLRKILSLGKPVVWTFHDMWPFTGGCHHSYECEAYLTACGNCPYLKNPGNEDISASIWKKKNSVYSKFDFTYVCVGTWLYSRASASSLLKGKNGMVIPNIVNSKTFKPLDKLGSRQKFNIPASSKVLLFASLRLDDPVKGWKYLTEAVEIVSESLPDQGDNLCVLLFGKRIKDKSLLEKISVKKIIISDLAAEEDLSELYSAADVTVVSSLYETFSLVACESLSCGTPVVAFDHSGPKDIIDHKINGYLASYKSSEDLARGILWCLNDPDISETQKNCRKKVIENFDYPVVVEKYIELYKALMQ